MKWAFGSESEKPRYFFYPRNPFSPLRPKIALIFWDPVPTSLRQREGSGSLRKYYSIGGGPWQHVSGSESIRTFILMANAAFLDSPPRSRRALNSFAPRFFRLVRRSLRNRHRRGIECSMAIFKHSLPCRCRFFLVLGTLSDPSCVQATFHAIVPS